MPGLVRQETGDFSTVRGPAPAGRSVASHYGLNHWPRLNKKEQNVRYQAHLPFAAFGIFLLLDPLQSQGQPGSTAVGSPLDLSGTWEQEAAITTDDGEIQKFEAIIEPRGDFEFGDDLRLTAIFRIRLDTEGELGPAADRPDNYSRLNGPWFNDQYAELSLREFYVDTDWAESSWRIGKQQVVWGQADGIKVLDVVNPQSFREFILDDFDDSRIPLWMLNAEVPVGSEGSLQFLWIPDTTYHELAEQGTPFAFSSPLMVPVLPPGMGGRVLSEDKPDDPLSDSDAGLRYRVFAGGWDLTINYLYHYQDMPVLYQAIEESGPATIATVSPGYERNHLFGGTASTVLGDDFTLRAELAINSDTYHISTEILDNGIAESGEVASVIGLDWQLGSADTLLSAQWFQSHLLDYDSSIVREKTEHNLSLLFRRGFRNETLHFNALGIYSPTNEDSWVHLKLSFLWRSNVEVWLGADVLSGDREGLFGQFNDQDRVLVGLEWGF